MNRAYPSPIDWKNYPITDTPLNQTNLNRMSSALGTIDERVVGFDTTKANKADMLTDVVNVSYNTTTGVWTFTRRNGSSFTYDQNIEKIPVSFSMDANGIITMTTADGTKYTADVGDKIKTYTFNDTSIIDFTTTSDASGNKTITATIKDGSITGSKLQPNYLADCTQQATNAAGSASNALLDATNAHADALLAQSYAVGGTGTRSGEDTDNAKYYKEQAALRAIDGHRIAGSTGAIATARPILLFANATITDNSTGNYTQVKVGIDDTEWAQITQLYTT